MPMAASKKMTGMAHIPVAHDCSEQGEPPYATVLEHETRETTPLGMEKVKEGRTFSRGYLLEVRKAAP